VDLDACDVGCALVADAVVVAADGTRNDTSASIVACGLSSITQWPVFGSVTDRAFVATS
jgi:hypothetical protein